MKQKKRTLKLASSLLLLTALLTAFLTLPSSALATLPVSDCVITNFNSIFNIKRDASVDVQEKLTVDCGNIPDKHGIFRIIPTKDSRSGYNKTAITLKSITDNSGNVYKYSTLKTLETVTWKIGDPNVTITGTKEYVIKYSVQNAVSNFSSTQNQFYWNISGQYWELPIDNFSATINFPEQFSKGEITNIITSGVFGSETNTLAKGEWQGNSYVVSANETITPGSGITIKSILPSGIISLYQPSFWQLYGEYLWYLIPIFTFYFAFKTWKKHGKDPIHSKTTMVQYEPPLEMLPLELGLLENSAGSNSYVTATIVDLAVKGFIKIEDLPKSGLFKKADWQLSFTSKDRSNLKPYEKLLLTSLEKHQKENKVLVSSLKDKFYSSMSEVLDSAKKESVVASLTDKNSLKPKIWTIVASIALLIAGVTIGQFVSYNLAAALIIAGVIAFVFGLLMSRRTAQGAEALWHLNGFKEYLSKAEKYRMEFYEKENIFEKYLPYAVAFGLTDKWLNAFKNVYAESYKGGNYIPSWYIAHGASSFDIGNFESRLDTLQSTISNNISSRPGSSSSGGGFSGGGGGGGGGGSW